MSTARATSTLAAECMLVRISVIWLTIEAVATSILMAS